MQEQHHGDHPGEGDDVAQDGDDAGREDLADRLHVAQDPGHDAPDGIPVEERGRETLDVGEEGGAQVVHDALTGPRREVDLRVAKRVLDGQGRREERDDPREPGPVSLEDVLVDGDLDQVRLDEVHRRQEREQRRRERRPRRGTDACRPRPVRRAARRRRGRRCRRPPTGRLGRGLMAAPGGSTSSGGLDRRLELLPPPQARVEPPAGEELRVGALLDEPALVEDDDAVEHRRDAEPVGDDQRGALPDAVEEARRGSPPRSRRRRRRRRRRGRGSAGRAGARAPGSPAGADRRRASGRARRPPCPSRPGAAPRRARGPPRRRRPPPRSPALRRRRSRGASARRGTPPAARSRSPPGGPGAGWCGSPARR